MVESGLLLPLREFRNRFALGGYWWTMHVNQTGGAYLARHGIRWGVHPNRVSLLTPVVGVATSALVVLTFPSNRILAGVVALVGWQLAYTLDCADGQIARATGQATPRGALLDLLCDFVLHVAVVLPAINVVSVTFERDTTLIGVLITAAWLIAPYYKGVLELLPSGMKSTGSSAAYNVVRHVRDFGLYVAVLPVAIVIGGEAVLGVLIVTSVLEFAALARGIWSYSRPGAEVDDL
jgi:phosphatidylglycerophosphate synthase